MQLKLQIFEYKSEQQANNVRTIEIDGEVWFVGIDIAKVLGYVNQQKAIRDHCKHYKSVGVNETVTLDPQTLIIPESDSTRYYPFDWIASIGYLGSSIGGITRLDKRSGFSIRCIKDQ